MKKIKNKHKDKNVMTGLSSNISYSNKNIISQVFRLFFRVDVFVASFFISIFSLALPLSILVVYDRIIPNQSTSSLYIIMAGVIVIVLLEVILRHMRSHILGWYAARYRYNILKSFYKKALYKPMTSKPKAYAQNLVEIESLEKQKDLVAQNMITIIFDVPFVFVMLLFLFLLGRWVVLVPIVILLVCFGVVRFYGKTLRDMDTHQKYIRKSKFDHYYSMLHHITTHKAQAKEKRMLGRAEADIEQQSQIFLKQQLSQATFQNIAQFMAQAGLISVVAIGCLLVIQETLSIGALAAITLMTGRLMQPLMRMMQTLLQLWRLDKIMIPSAPLLLRDHQKQEQNAAKHVLSESIRLQDITYRYDKDGHNVINQLNLQAEMGDIIAIQGDSASGKTTLLNLLRGNISIESGKLWVDHVVVAADEKMMLADKVAYVHPYESLLPGSIKDNLLNFNDDIDFKDLDKLIKICQLDKEIGQLPEGLATQVGHQVSDTAFPSSMLIKLFIIRAAISKPKLLLIDDIAVGIDGKTIQDLSRLLRFLAKDMMIIITSQLAFFGQIATQEYYFKKGELIRLQRRDKKPAETSTETANRQPQQAENSKKE
jgi:ATP-binding cassette subfamily C protein LapB